MKAITFSGVPAKLRCAARDLRRDADRAVVRVAHPGHDAAFGDHGRRAKGVLVGAEQGGDHHVAPRLDPAVDAQAHPMPQAVGEQGLLRLGKADLPGQPGVFDGVRGDDPVPPACPLMTITSAPPLATPAAMVPTPVWATSFTEISAPGWPPSGRRSTGPGPRWSRCRGEAAAR